MFWLVSVFWAASVQISKIRSITRCRLGPISVLMFCNCFAKKLINLYMLNVALYFSLPTRLDASNFSVSFSASTLKFNPRLLVPNSKWWSVVDILLKVLAYKLDFFRNNFIIAAEKLKRRNFRIIKNRSWERSSNASFGVYNFEQAPWAKYLLRL